MALDNSKNFAKTTVSTGYTSSATSIVLSTGHGALLPAVPFNAVWYNATDYPDPSDDPNKEIVRVTAIATDTLTITRAQEGTTATNKNTSAKTYKLIAGLTAKTMTDITNLGMPVFNVLAYGATGNGSTDDTGAIQSAVAERHFKVTDIQHISDSCSSGGTGSTK